MPLSQASRVAGGHRDQRNHGGTEDLPTSLPGKEVGWTLEGASDQLARDKDLGVELVKLRKPTPVRLEQSEVCVGRLTLVQTSQHSRELLG